MGLLARGLRSVDHDLRATCTDKITLGTDKKALGTDKVTLGTDKKALGTASYLACEEKSYWKFQCEGSCGKTWGGQTKQSTTQPKFSHNSFPFLAKCENHSGKKQIKEGLKITRVTEEVYREVLAAKGDYVTPSIAPPLDILPPPPMTLEERMKTPSICALVVGDDVKKRKDGRVGRVVRVDFKVGEVQGDGTEVWVKYPHSADSYQCLRKNLVLMRPTV